MTFQVSASLYPELGTSIPSGIMMVSQKRWKKNLLRLKPVQLVNIFAVFLRTGSNSTFFREHGVSWCANEEETWLPG